ncbi:hypothetical protein GCK72_012185 [Caenorhabditis remanei]|uniref:Uncharacterized protein n=1 Tax=Caenorhabditis remanei TaxID=31234 RepID=A0A6A5GMH9_CAERE|nr:hypothetical protein GCK72_012183 [Caenorhabditis remanei]XP_053583673.1 hypothetical protein GCK72_012185 [Caenorhabditis remanei]KAF1755733.1 hypothetical protein GCK72_012183 [Caenorhabditis remanei]KAF1755735.1 hypothetical protein GCK72_012185 [Caenorhabditis remanei]
MNRKTLKFLLIIFFFTCVSQKIRLDFHDRRAASLALNRKDQLISKLEIDGRGMVARAMREIATIIMASNAAITDGFTNIVVALNFPFVWQRSVQKHAVMGNLKKMQLLSMFNSNITLGSIRICIIGGAALASIVLICALAYFCCAPCCCSCCCFCKRKTKTNPLVNIV